MNNNNSSVIWLNIKKDLEYKIINETYKSSMRMPSISEIAEIYSCGDSTAQKVLESLCSDGVLTKKQGVGYFVKPFCRAQLLDKNMAIFKSNFEMLVKDARLLGIDEKSLENLLTRSLHAHSKCDEIAFG